MNVTYGVCQICGKFCDWIPTHMRYSHGMSMDEYLQLHPESNRQQPFRVDIVPAQPDLSIAAEARPYQSKMRIWGMRK